MISKTSECTNCDNGPCYFENSKQLTCVGRCFSPTDKYQITEIQEPVAVLDIQYPVSKRFVMAAATLQNADGKKVEIGPSDSEDLYYHCASGYNIPKSWLKQKPAEPTREELQERLTAVVDEVRLWMRSNISVDLVEELENIANGEK